MSNLKAFLVEDSPLIREQLIGTLAELGAVDVIGFAEGESDAVAWLNTRSAGCDLIIIDVFLKDGSGLGVLSAARDLGGHMSLVVLTNFTSSALRRGCERLGATRVFDKSCEIDDLVAFCAGLSQSGNMSWWSAPHPLE